MNSVRMPEAETQWLRFEDLSSERLYELLRFRQSIFVVEQRSPYPDLDGLDQSAWHLLLRVGGRLCGYLRVIPATGPPPAVRIGRVAVSARLRRQGIGRRLMDEALLRSHELYPGRQVLLNAQLYLSPFYQSFGFIALSDPYDDFGVAHVEMALR